MKTSPNQLTFDLNIEKPYDPNRITIHPLINPNTSKAVVLTYPGPNDFLTERLCSSSGGRTVMDMFRFFGYDPKEYSYFVLINEQTTLGIQPTNSVITWCKNIEGEYGSELKSSLREFNPSSILALGEAPFYVFNGREKDSLDRVKELKNFWNVWDTWEGIPIIYSFNPNEFEKKNSRLPEFAETIKRFATEIGHTHKEPQIFIPETLSELKSNLNKYVLTKPGTNLVEYDIETSGFNPHTREVLCIGLCGNEDYAVIITDDLFNKEGVISLLETFFNHDRVILASHNGIGFDDIWMKENEKFKIKVNSAIDSLPGHYLFFDERTGKHSLDAIAQFYDAKSPWKHAVDRYKDKNWGYKFVPRDILYKYLGWDVVEGFRMSSMVLEEKEKPENAQLSDLYDRVYAPCAKMLGEMKVSGVKLDVDYLHELKQEWLNELEPMLQALKGFIEYYNAIYIFMTKDKDPKFVMSAARMSEFLYERLGLKAYAENIEYYMFEDEDGNFRCDKEEIYSYTKSANSNILTKVMLKIPKNFYERDYIEKIFKLYIEYSRLRHLFDNFVEANIKRLDENGFVHPSLNLQGTRTGRLSGGEGSFQNIPEHDKDGRNKQGLIPRATQLKHMIVAPKGYKILHADYSQIELRMMAELSQDEFMLDNYAKGIDLHLATAIHAYNLDAPGLETRQDYYKELYKEERSKAKTINFGIPYGMGVMKLANSIGSSKEEAKNFLNAHKAMMPKVHTLLNKFRDYALRNNYVYTIYGNKERFPYILNDFQSAAVRREAGNTPIQGPSSILCMRSCLKSYNEIPHIEAIPFNLVHDAQFWYIREDVLEERTKHIITNMENPEDFQPWFTWSGKVKFAVEYEILDRL
jgi:DNA polymerase I